jgi:adenylylsulfate kinase-like enzyme
MIYVLYGQPASGKTTLGNLLADHLNTPFIIDGDEFRGMFTNKNYGKEGREENIRNANAVATYLNKKGKEGNWTAVYCRDTPNSIKGHPVDKETHVVVSLVNPYEHLRNELRKNNGGQVTEVFLTSGRELRKAYHVEDFEIGNPDYIMNTDQEVNDSWVQLKGLLRYESKN